MSDVRLALHDTIGADELIAARARIAAREGEIARLTAINADLRGVNLSHAVAFARIAAERDKMTAKMEKMQGILNTLYQANGELEGEVARLTAINADLRGVNLSHAEALARLAELEAALAQVRNDNPVLSRIAELEATLAEQQRTAANLVGDVVRRTTLAEREACASMDIPIPDEVYDKHVYREAIEAYSAAIRARSQP